jgi:DNA adenine methylase
MTPYTPYVGSKRVIAPLLLPYFPPHSTFADLFFGGGNMFFAKCAAGMKAKHNILNDLDGDVVNFFYVCQHYESELLHVWNHSPIADDIFNAAKLRYKQPLPADASVADKVQRAADWLYLRDFSLYAQMSTMQVKKDQSFRHCNTTQKISSIKNLLIDCSIVNRDAVKALNEFGAKRNDFSDVFAYCDPPYIDSAQPYKADMWNAKSLHDGMRYAISEYDSPTIREIAAQYGLMVHEITVTRSMGKKPNTDVLLTNYKPTYRLF